jgi:hypothetical protein
MKMINHAIMELHKLDMYELQPTHEDLQTNHHSNKVAFIQAKLSSNNVTINKL